MSTLKFQFYCDGNLIRKLIFHGKEARSVSIGRAESDIVLPVEGVSRIHAQLIYDGESVYIADCSTNGTVVNGRKLTGKQPLLLNKNDVVTFDNAGISRMVVSSVDEPAEQPGEDNSFTKTIFHQLRDKDTMTIGRSPDSDIVLSHHTVSRIHASVKRTPEGKYIVTDEGSLNGVFINGKKIKKEVLNADDKLFIGRFQLTLDTAQRNLTKGSAIKAYGVSKKYWSKKDKKDKIALDETSFDLPTGGVIAIMGPSGCGKSTLLKVLNGALLPTNGTVYINGLELIENLPYLKTQIGYVPQDDIVHKQLTVWESVYYAAKIRLNGAPDDIIEKKITGLLRKLNIIGEKDLLVSAISGGQRKRVCIAVELLSDPAILFLDEPTSPLDPQNIKEFMGILRSLSEGGTTIVMVTHKPEDLNYMDRVIFMTKGSLVFYGNINEYKSYFEVADAIDVYVNISGEKAPLWIKKFTDSLKLPASVPLKDHKRERNQTNAVTQFYWLLSRYFRIKQNDWKTTLFMLLQAPIIACLICLVFREIKLGVLFLTSISAIWFGINNSAREIVSEDAVYGRERMFNLLIFPYVFSKIVMLAAFAIVQSFLFISIIWLYYGRHEVHWDLWLEGVGWMFYITFCASLIGLLISAANQTTEKAMTVVPLVIIPQIMLAGVITVINSSMVELLSYFTISRWGTEGFTHIQQNVRETLPDPIKQIPLDTTLHSFTFMKKSFHDTYWMIFDDHAGTFQLNAIILAFMSVICLASIWIFLSNKDKKQL